MPSVLVRRRPVPVARVGVRRRFGAPRNRMVLRDVWARHSLPRPRRSVISRRFVLVRRGADRRVPAHRAPSRRVPARRRPFRRIAARRAPACRGLLRRIPARRAPARRGLPRRIPARRRIARLHARLAAPPRPVVESGVGMVYPEVGPCFPHFMGTSLGPVGRPWCEITPLLEYLRWARLISPALVPREGPASKYFASARYALLLLSLWWRRRASAWDCISEFSHLLRRRWILASEPGPVSSEDMSQVADGLGWDGWITAIRPSLTLCQRVTRFIYRGNSWTEDITGVSDPTGVSGITPVDARRCICRA